jgi:hypothetical protein
MAAKAGDRYLARLTSLAAMHLWYSTNGQSIRT